MTAYGRQLTISVNIEDKQIEGVLHKPDEDAKTFTVTEDLDGELFAWLLELGVEPETATKIAEDFVTGMHQYTKATKKASKW